MNLFESSIPSPSNTWLSVRLPNVVTLKLWVCPLVNNALPCVLGKISIDADKGLSDIISTETDNRISDTTFLSGELIALSGHYQSNMAVDVALPYFIDKPDGSRERVEKIVDQLLISDEDDPTVTYKLTIKGGVLTIVKHSID